MSTCCSTDHPQWDRDQSDYLTGSVSVNVPIVSQDVAISFDGVTWITAEWTGSPGNSRNWEAYLTPGDIPAGQSYEVTVRITDTSGPEPVEAHLNAGTITFT